MSELEAIQDRARERLHRIGVIERNSGRRLHATGDCDEAEADLDRARAIAEEKQIAFNMMMDARVEVSTGEAEQMRTERDAARVLADQLAAVVRTHPGFFGPESATYAALKAHNDRDWE